MMVHVVRSDDKTFCALGDLCDCGISSVTRRSVL